MPRNNPFRVNAFGRGNHGEQLWGIYRLKNPSAGDVDGNREFYRGLCPDRDLQLRIARALNENEGAEYVSD